MSPIKPFPRIGRLQRSLTSPLLIKKSENLLYLTGRSFIHGWLLVMPFVRHSESRDKSGRRISRSFAVTQDDIVFFGDGLEKVEKIHTDKLENVRMYLGGYRKLRLEDNFSFAEANFLKKRLGAVELEPVESPVEKLREIKDAGEIGRLRASGKIVEKVWQQVKKDLLKKIWTEAGLAARIVDLGRSFGAESVSFDPIVAAGANAATPHHVPGFKKLSAGEPIIMDFGFKYKGYCGDFTRTVFLTRAPKKWVEIYNQVEKAHAESVRFVSSHNSSQPPLIRSAGSGQASRGGAARAGSSLKASGAGRAIKASEVYQKAVEVLAEKHLDKYFIHNLGHGTGLAIHERPYLSPASEDIFKNGMVFSIEPGVYLPQLGGIRIEDLVYLDREKVKNFFASPTDIKSNIVK